MYHNQNQAPKYYCEVITTLSSRGLENLRHHHQENQGLQEDPQDPIATQDHQRGIMEKSKVAAR